MPNENQIQRKMKNTNISSKDLLKVPKGKITINGLRENIKIGIQYVEAWLNGNGCVPLYNLMEDAATAEISRSQLWQWLKHEKEINNEISISCDYYDKIMTEELSNIKELYGEEIYNNRKFKQASEMFSKMISGDVLDEFLTLPAYKYI